MSVVENQVGRMTLQEAVQHIRSMAVEEAQKHIARIQGDKTLGALLMDKKNPDYKQAQAEWTALHERAYPG